MHVALTNAPPGSVLVVEVGGQPERGYWGEVLTTAEARGIAGLVIEGGVRDLDALEAHGFPGFQHPDRPARSHQVAGGVVGADATVGDVDVRSGDWVAGDADGVVIIDAVELAAVVAAGLARAEREQELFVLLRRGATTMELLGLDPTTVRRPDEGRAGGDRSLARSGSGSNAPLDGRCRGGVGEVAGLPLSRETAGGPLP